MRARIVVGVIAGLLLQLVLPARATFVPDDPRFDRQWGLETIGAPAAWAKGMGEGVTIAVIDTGVDLGHEDLAGKITAHVSCIGADDDPGACTGSGQDADGHGTHVAGIAAAATGNGTGVASVAPEAGIMAVKVLEPNPAGEGASGSISDIRAGIRWAVDHGADVVNLSLGEGILVRNLFGSSLEEAIEDAWDAGVVPVVAAGNTNNLFNSGYGRIPALVVAATTPDDTKAGYSTDVGDAPWAIAAPGGEGDEDDPDERKIYSTLWTEDKGAGYGWGVGTSMATPHVSGAVAVLRSRGFSPQQAVDQLLATAVDLGVKGRDRDFGNGRLDLAAAAAGLSDHSDRLPASTTTTQPAPAPAPASAATVATQSTSARRVTPTTSPAVEQPSTSTSVSPITITEPVAVAPQRASDASPRGGVGGWAVVAGTALVLATLGLRGVWRRRLPVSSPARL